GNAPEGVPPRHSIQRLDRGRKSLAGKLFDVQLRTFEISGQENGSPLVMCLPHLVRGLGAWKSREFHHAADHIHEIGFGVAVEDHLVTGQLPFARRLWGGARRARALDAPPLTGRTISVRLAHGAPPCPKGRGSIWLGPRDVTRSVSILICPSARRKC